MRFENRHIAAMLTFRAWLGPWLASMGCALGLALATGHSAAVDHPAPNSNGSAAHLQRAAQLQPMPAMPSMPAPAEKDRGLVPNEAFGGFPGIDPIITGPVPGKKRA